MHRKNLVREGKLYYNERNIAYPTGSVSGKCCLIKEQGR